MVVCVGVPTRQDIKEDQSGCDGDRRKRVWVQLASVCVRRGKIIVEGEKLTC